MKKRDRGKKEKRRKERGGKRIKCGAWAESKERKEVQKNIKDKAKKKEERGG